MSRVAHHGAFVVILLTFAAPAAAQTTKGFVEGGLLADYDPTLRSETSTTAGVTGSAGFFLSRRLSLRLEVDYPQWHSTTRAGQGQVRDRIERFALREEGRAPSVSVLAGFHPAQDSRVSVSFVAGATRARREWRNSGTTETLDLQGNVIERREVANRSDHDWYAVTAGSDVTIAVTKHLALVPQIRLHSYLYSEHTSVLFVRPRVALRWRF